MSSMSIRHLVPVTLHIVIISNEYNMIVITTVLADKHAQTASYESTRAMNERYSKSVLHYPNYLLNTHNHR